MSDRPESFYERLSCDQAAVAERAAAEIATLRRKLEIAEAALKLLSKFEPSEHFEDRFQHARDALTAMAKEE